jgi:glutathione peroxidase-family protein
MLRSLNYSQPGSDKEIESFCALKGVKDANVFVKADVNGPKTRPTYKFLKEKGILGDVAWNFAGSTSISFYFTNLK